MAPSADMICGRRRGRLRRLMRRQ